MRNNKIHTILTLSIVALTLTTFAEDGSKQKPLFPVSIDHEFSNPDEVFEEVRTLILNNYYTTQITDADLYWAAIKGMLRHISPPETPELATITTPEAYDRIANSLKGVKVAIGIKSSYSAGDGSLTVTEVLEGSPAESILQPYDRILRIDGKQLKGLGVKEINQLMEGAPDTEVSLTVIRDIRSFELTIKRQEFKVKNLTVSILPPGDVGFVELKRVTADMAAELRSALDGLKESGITKLILDFRNNPGGVFIDSLRIAEIFLPEKNILLRTLSRSDKPQNYVSSNKTPLDFDMVILVNKNTASSCEIIVGALQDSKKALILGSNTYGKAVFEKTFTLESEYRVKFISGAMYSPLGKSWHTKGILPDFRVTQDAKTYLALTKLEPADRVNKDIYLQTAIKLINK